jgi:putative transposase
VLQEEHALLKKTHPVHLRTNTDVFAFIEEERQRFGVTRLCRLFAVTRAGFYAWHRRPRSARRRQDRALLEEMRAIFERSGGTYGSPRIQRALTGDGIRVSRRRVERLMRQDGLRARVARIYRGKAGVHRWFSRQPNHVRRTQATRPNQIWVGNVTYLAVGGRWWYLVVVLDQCSRRVLAWRLAGTRDSRVTRRVLDAALRRRRPAPNLIFYSDRGSEFQGLPVRARLAVSGVRQSMTRGGAPGENAHMESFFHSRKADLVHGRSFQTVAELRRQLRHYIRYYYHDRLYSALGYQSPVDYERRAA